MKHPFKIGDRVRHLYNHGVEGPVVWVGEYGGLAAIGIHRPWATHFTKDCERIEPDMGSLRNYLLTGQDEEFAFKFLKGLKS